MPGDFTDNPIIKIILQLEGAANNEAEVARVLGIAQAQAASFAAGNTAGDTAANEQAAADAAQNHAEAEGNVLEQVHQINEETARIGENVKQAGVAVTGIMGYTLVRVGRQFEQFAKLIISPFTNFIKDAGMYEAVSIRSTAATTDLAEQWNRVGRVMADTIVPAEESAAKVIGKLADFVEANPWVAQVGVYIAAGLALVGTLAITFGTILNAMAAMRILQKVFMADRAVAGAGEVAVDAMEDTSLIEGGAPAAAPAAGAGASIVAPLLAVFSGAVLGVIIYDAIAKALHLPSAGTEVKQAWGVAMAGIGGTAGAIVSLFEGKGLSGFATGAKAAFDWMNKLTGVTNTVAGAATAASLGLTGMAAAIYNATTKTQMLTAWDQFQKDTASAAQNYTSDLAAAQKDADDKILAETNDYNSKRKDLVEKQMSDELQVLADNNLKVGREDRDYAQSEADAERDYMAQRLKTARDAGVQALKDEQAYQLKMSRMTEDHNDKMWDLAGQRDAGAMIQEMRAYEKERRRAEEDHNLALSQQHAALALQLADQAAAFKQARDRRLRDFQQQRGDEAADFALQQARTAAENKEKLDVMDKEHADAIAKIKADFADQNNKITTAYNTLLNNLTQGLIDRINILDPYLLKTTAQLQTDAANSFATFVAWMNQIKSGNVSGTGGIYPVRRRATGGDWITSGPENLLVGEAGPERVTIIPLTGLASRMVASRNPTTVTSAQQTVHLNDQRRFYGGITNAERRAIHQDTVRTLKEVLG